MTTALEHRRYDTFFICVPQEIEQQPALSPVAAVTGTARAVASEEQSLTDIFGTCMYDSTVYMLSDLAFHVAGQSMPDRTNKVRLAAKTTMGGHTADLLAETRYGTAPFLRPRELGVATVGLYQAATHGSLEAADVLVSDYLAMAWELTTGQATNAYEVISDTLDVTPNIIVVQGIRQQCTMMSYA